MYVVHTQRDIPADSMFLSFSFDIRCFACCDVWLYDSPIAMYGCMILRLPRAEIRYTQRNKDMHNEQQ